MCIRDRAWDIKLNTLSIPLIQIKKEIDDQVKIDYNFIDKYVVPINQNEVLSNDDIIHTEIVTRGQSENKLWQQLHQFKATTSNFGKIIKCSINPDGLLHAMFYSDPHSAALSYGKVNEHNAIEDYIDYKKAQGIDVSVQSVGMILSKDRPGFGANLTALFQTPLLTKKADLK